MFQKLFIILFFFPIVLVAQTNTKGINYQAVILDPKQIDVPGVAIAGQPLASGNVCVKFSILNGQVLEFEETQATQTDEYGLINLTIGNGQPTANSKVKTFDALKWSSKTFALSVSVSFDNCATFKVVSTQLFNYTPYALYAEAVEYTNVRNAPNKLSDFSNDVGFITEAALTPLKDSIAVLRRDSQQQFAIVNQDISILNNQVLNLNKEFDSKLTGVSTNLSSQINNVNSRIDQLGGTFEVLGNKSTATDLGGTAPSDTKYPSQKAVKTYIDITVQDAIASGAPDATTLAKGKVKLAGDLSGTADNPTVPGLLNKEDLANKTSNIAANANSQIKYPTVKAIKDYVDASVTGLAFQANLDLKADKDSPTFTGTPVLPGATIGVTQGINDNSTKLATTAFVQTALSAGVIDATTSVKGKIKLAGDLSGTADSPTVPGLSLKEEVANKSNDAALGESTTLYPTQLAVKTYVDNQISTATVADASSSVKGKIQLGGDLAGTGSTASAPKITDGAITSTKIANLSVTDAKIAAVGGAKVQGDIAGNAQNVNGIVEPINGGTGVGGTLSGYIKGNGVAAMTSTQTIPVTDIVDGQKVSNLSIATDLGGNAASDVFYPSQLAVKTYVDNQSNGAIGTTTQSALNGKEDVANKDSNVNLGTSNTLYPTQNAVKTYVDSKLGGTNAITSLSSLPNISDKTVLGNMTGAVSTPQELPVTGTGSVVFNTNPNISSPTLTGPKLEGTITGSAVLSIANGGTGSSSLPSGYVKGGANSLTTVASIPWQDVNGGIHSVNGNLADPQTGNVSIAFGKVTTGLLNARPDVSLTNNGDIYVVSGETGANAMSNGLTFISTGGASGTWNEVTTNQASLDARYVQLSGSVMNGNLSFPTGTKITMQDAPVTPTDLANKGYVDAAVLAATPNATTLSTGKIQLSGDLAGTATAPIVQNKAINFAKIQDVSSNTILGRTSAGSGSVEALSTLPIATLPALTGDVVTTAGSASTTIQDHAVTFSKMQQLSGQRLLLGTGSTGGTNVSEISLGAGLSMTNGVLSATGGTVTNVTGTSNRIDVSNGTATPSIDISSTYEGQTSIQTVGTITTGTWNASKIAVASGGTGATTFSAGYLKANGSNPFSTVSSIPVSDVANAESVLHKSTATDLDGNLANHTNYPTQLAVKTYVDASISAAATPMATTSVLGKVQLGGDLAGSGTSAAAPIISTDAINSTKIKDGEVKSADLAAGAVLNSTIGEIIAVTKGGSGADLSTTAGYLKQASAGANFSTVSTIPVADVSGAVQKVNGNAPDASGNVTLFYGEVTTGLLANLPVISSTANGDIFVVAGETGANAGNNGRTFISTGPNGIWNEVAPDLASLDARYVRLAGGTMDGSLTMPTGTKLTLTDAPTTATDAVNKEYVDAKIIAATPDATTSVKGKLQLAGDLSGTADLPRVANGAITSAKMANGAILNTAIGETISVAKGGTGASTLTGYVKGNGSNAMTASATIPVADVTGAQTTANLSTNMTADANSASKYPSVAAVETYVSTNATPSASSTAEGKLKLAQDLAGTSSAPKVVGIQGVAISSTTPSTNQFLKYNGTTWVPANMQLETEEFSANSGQTEFVLSNTPLGKVAFFRNGARLPKASISIAGTTVTYIPANNNAEILVAGDRITIDYVY